MSNPTRERPPCLSRTLLTGALLLALGLGRADAAFVSTWDTTRTSSGSSAADQVALPLEEGGEYDFVVDWGDGSRDTITAWEQPERVHTYAEPGVYRLSIEGTLTGWQFNNSGDRLKILEIHQWGSLRLGNTGGYFSGTANLSITAEDQLNLAGTTDLNHAFRGSGITTVPGMDAWDVSRVTNLHGMFNQARAFNQDLSRWDVSHVTMMRNLFTRAERFNQDISGWDVGNVRDMRAMFAHTPALDQSVARKLLARVLARDDLSPAMRVSHLRDLASAYLADEDHAAARRTLEEALELEAAGVTATAETMSDLAGVDRAEGNHPAARERLEQALALPGLPDRIPPGLLADLADSYHAQEDLPGMMAVVDRYLALEQVAASFKQRLVTRLADLALRLQDDSRAADAYERLAALPLDAASRYAAYEHLAAARLRLGDFAGLRVALEAARTIEDLADEQLLTLKLRFAGAYGAEGDLDQMQRFIRTAETDHGTLDIRLMLQALWEAGRFYLPGRYDGVVRQFLDRADVIGRIEPKRVRCRVLDQAPVGAGGWAASDFVQEPANREARFYAYGKWQDSAEVIGFLAADAAADRPFAADAEGSGETAFFMAYDTRGWHLYVQSDEPRIQRIMEEGGRGASSLEMFFSPGRDGETYYQWIIRLASGEITHYPWQSPQPGYRYLDGANGFRAETVELADGWGTAIFIPWERLYDKLPFVEGNDEYWRFSMQRWDPSGSVTWGGKVHETGRWGLVEWDPPTPAQRRAILSRLVRRAWWNYQETKNPLVDVWSCPRRGDPEFYRTRLEPVIDRYAAYGAKIDALEDWDDQQVEDVFSNLVPGWMEFDYEVAALRAAYLSETLIADGKPEPDRDGEPWADAPVRCHIVPAISSVRRLPDTPPPDGVVDDRIALIGAQGEFVPASFLVEPRRDVSAFALEASALHGVDAAGELTGVTIPAEAVDLKVVKVWWQAGTAWNSYFADPTKRELVPELLLNDDSLIRVDMDRRDNYLRVDYPAGAQYVWISAPAEIDDGGFDHHREPVADSPFLLPVALETGRFRQFWITVSIPADAAAGHYTGTLALKADHEPAGAITLNLRVLPFSLPEPKTYYDLDQRFLTSMYGPHYLQHHLDRSGNDWELSERKLRAEMKNMLAHNLTTYQQGRIRRFTDETRKVFIRNLELVRETGFPPPLFGGFSSSSTFFFPRENEPAFEQYMRDAAEALDLAEEILGHREVYFFGMDEPGRSWVDRQVDGWKALHEIGARVYSTARDWHYNVSGYLENIVNYAGWHVSREISAKWNLIGHGVMNYAGPHTGPENPDLSRRAHGMRLYKAWYRGSGNYKYYDQHNIWNDFASYRFRGFNMVYPTQTGVIDTIAWEGFREGIDDVRYATKLKQLADAAIADEAVERVFAGKKALMWLERLDADNADLNTMRLEMIRQILELLH